MKRIFVKNIDIISEIIKNDQTQMSYYNFLSKIKDFLGHLLIDPINSKPDISLIACGLYKSRLLKLLINRNIIERDTDINYKDGHAMFKIKYRIPKKNFERKIKRLYSKIFEVNLPHDNRLMEDGEGDGTFGGATSSAVSNDNAPIAPLGQVQRRNIYITNEQLKKIQEALSTFSAGDYQYDVPFQFKDENGNNDETYIHNKPGGISVEIKK